MRAIILDLVGSNSHSVRFWGQRNGLKSEIYSSKVGLNNDDLLIVPGVLSFDSALKQIRHSGYDELIKCHLKADGKLVGICCGMQIFFETSEEGLSSGLGLLPGRISSMPRGTDTVPNTGWKYIEQSGRMLKYVDSTYLSYFMHSFALIEYSEPIGDDITILRSECNGQFVSGIVTKNLLLTQYHPEKSYIYGDKLLRSFIEYA